MSHLDSKLTEFMFNMRNNYKLLKKLDNIAEENKFWKDLILGLQTHACIKSGLVPPTTTHDFVTHPTTLQDLCTAAGKKIAKEYVFKDLFVKVAATDVGTSKATRIFDEGVPTAEHKRDNEDVVDNIA